METKQSVRQSYGYGCNKEPIVVRKIKNDASTIN